MRIIKASGALLTEDGMPVLIRDGVKEAKESKKMPAVKKHHQESTNSSKPEYIFGHLFGVIGVLTGNKKTFCTPVLATIQDGVNTIREWKDSTYEETSHVVQMIRNAVLASSVFGKCILLLDRYFLSGSTLKECGDSLNVITQAKMSAVACEEPIRKAGRGRPSKKGERVKLRELFTACKNEFSETVVLMYGKFEKVQYLCKDLLWGQELYKKLRFVLVNYNGREAILVSTNLEFSAEKIIRLYSYRFKIEVVFRELKQIIAGFSYHFWSKAAPKLNKYLKRKERKPLEEIQNKRVREKIISSFDAIKGYVQFSCIAIGLLQMLSVKFSKELNQSNLRWLRTQNQEVISEGTMAEYVRKTIFSMFDPKCDLEINTIIKSKQVKKYSDPKVGFCLTCLELFTVKYFSLTRL